MAGPRRSGSGDHETTRDCRFTTSRLEVGPWHELADTYGLDLIEAVRVVLTPSTTAALPPDWQADLDGDRAREWVQARDAESPTLLVVAPESGSASGLLVLFEVISRLEPGRMELRIGYVLAEWAWGRGLATELVGGLVDWARARPVIRALSGGVAPSNEASARVLTANGFVLSDPGGPEHVYELRLGGPQA